MQLIKIFVMPILIGIFIGIFGKQTDSEMIVAVVYTASDVIRELLLFLGPWLIIVFVSLGLFMIKNEALSFFMRFFGILVISLFFAAILALVLSYTLIPLFIEPFNIGSEEWLEPLFYFRLPRLDSFVAIVIGVICGFIMKEDSFLFRFMTKFGEYIYWIMSKVIFPLFPLLIIGTFAQAAYVSAGGDLFVMHILLSLFIVVTHFIFLVILYIFTNKYAKVPLKKLVTAGTSMYLMVLSIMGMGGAANTKHCCEMQKEVGVAEGKAQIISASSLHMPGSVISNIVFAIGVMSMFGYELVLSQLFVYAMLLIFATMIAPSMPGGVFSVTSTLLEPVLGFTDEMITVMSTLYYKQGTTNTAVNNTADICLGALVDKENIGGLHEDNSIK